MASTDSKASKAAKSKGPSNEQIIGGFQELRQQQRAIAGKISELEMERKEHELVLETLKEVDVNRKCFRLVGGVLVERTVKEVLPALTTNHQQICKLIETLTKQLENRGKEINEYREKYNIRVRGEEDKSAEPEKENKPSSTSQGVLVAGDS